LTIHEREIQSEEHKCGRLSIAASILQSGLSISDILAITYGDIKEELEKSITPLCLDLTFSYLGTKRVLVQPL
jgi:hypothetical protein